MPTCFTSITVPVDLRAALGELKRHPRQAYHEVIGLLLAEAHAGRPRKRTKVRINRIGN